MPHHPSSPRPDAHARRRWWLGVAVVLVAALAVARVGLEQTAGTAAAASPAAPPTALPGGTRTPAPHVAPRVRGTVTAEAPDGLTVAATSGATVTVALDAGTRYGTHRAPVTRAAVTVGSAVAVVGDLADGSVTATRVLLEPTPTTAPSSPPPAPAPTATTTPAAPVDADARCDVAGAAQAAVGVATADGERAAVAVLDTTTGTYTAAGEADTTFSTASVVKVLIATELLLTGQMSGDTAATAREMITASDDDDADALYGLAGGDDVLPDVAAHYGITDLGSGPAEEGQWGETQVTADGLAHLYAALHADPVVWPWLSSAMAATSRTADDGTDQYFGLPAVAHSWSVKQGWMVGLGPGATYNSTGFVDADRWVVVLLTQGAADQYGQEMASVLTRAAGALLPDGTAPGTAC